MRRLTPQQAETLRLWFTPEEPGPVVGMHVIQTGHGACFADRWPEPRAILAQTSVNYLLLGDPQVLTPAALASHTPAMFAASASFLPLLRSAFGVVHEWPRVVYTLAQEPSVHTPSGYVVRRLGAMDSALIADLDEDLRWIYVTWGSPAMLASSGYAWGALDGDRLVSLACTFFLGDQYEDIGVVTAVAHRRRGLSAACAAGLCRDILQRGRTPSWTTSTDNVASAAVAEKLGFAHQRYDVLYLVGMEPPPP